MGSVKLFCAVCVLLWQRNLWNTLWYVWAWSVWFYFACYYCVIQFRVDMKVDAFTESAFKGNPAAVCLLEEEKEDSWMQGVATEFNLSETCYLTPIAESERSDISLNRFRLRWFTPATEVNFVFLTQCPFLMCKLSCQGSPPQLIE